jgi:hypothetical protein
VGDLQFGGFTRNLGMGGIAIGANTPFNINVSNPASYSSIALTTFEMAVNGNFIQLKNSTQIQNTNNASLSYFALAFPVVYKKWGMSFGLLPYSNVGYNINDSQSNADSAEEFHSYNGSGGLNQFYIGNAWSPYKNFSIGANASYLFGDLTQVRRVFYESASNYLNLRVTEVSHIGDLFFNYGMQYTFDSLRTAPSDSVAMFNKQLDKIEDSLSVISRLLTELDNLAKSDSAASASQKQNLASAISSLKNEMTKAETQRSAVVNRKQKSNWSLILGLTGSPSANISGNHTLLSENYRLYFEQEIVRDTIQNTTDENSKLVLPLSVGFGFSLKQGSRWIVGGDFSMQNWKDYSIFGSKDSLADSWRTSAGAQFTPNERDIKSYWKAVQYRLGFHYSQTYLQLRNSQLSEYGVTIGFGLPIKRVATTLQFSAEAGRRGTISNSLIEENYIKLSVGFTLNDRWFVKPKYD